MKIAFVCFEAFDSGGIATYTRELLNRMAKLGHDITLFAPTIHRREDGLDPALKLHPIPVADLPLTSAVSFWAALPLAFRRAERTMGQFDIVHSNTYGDVLLRRRASAGIRITTVHHLGTSAAESMGVPAFKRILHLSREYGPAVALEGVCLRHAHHLVAVSQFSRDDLLRRYPDIDSKSVSVIHLGANNRTSRVTQDDIEGLRGRLAIRPSDRILLYVGRLEERKGIPTLFKALSKLDERTGAKLLLVGTGNGGKYKALATANGIGSRVIFAGVMSNEVLDTAYGLATLLVHPAAIEGFGLTIADAVASGLPVVATKAGAIPEIVRDRTDGLLVKYGDSQALADAIATILGDSPRSSTKPISDKAPVFSWNEMTARTLALYERLLSQSR